MSTASYLTRQAHGINELPHQDKLPAAALQTLKNSTLSDNERAQAFIQHFNFEQH